MKCFLHKISDTTENIQISVDGQNKQKKNGYYEYTTGRCKNCFPIIWLRYSKGLQFSCLMKLHKIVTYGEFEKMLKNVFSNFNFD